MFSAVFALVFVPILIIAASLAIFAATKKAEG